jgi:hypothetical protein
VVKRSGAEGDVPELPIERQVHGAGDDHGGYGQHEGHRDQPRGPRLLVGEGQHQGCAH